MNARVFAGAFLTISLVACSTSRQTVVPTRLTEANVAVTSPNRAATDAWSRAPLARIRRNETLNSDGSPTNAHGSDIDTAGFAPTTAANMTYHSGGYVGHQPNLAIVTWGFAPNDITKDPLGEANHIYDFLIDTEATAPGSWQYTTTQYTGLWGSPPYTTSAIFPPHVIMWSDTGSSPASGFNDYAVQNEVVRAANAIAPGTNVYGNGWQYVVLTPTNVFPAWFAKKWCAYHYSDQYTAYAIVPYQSDANKVAGFNACGADSINPGTTGLLDGATIVTGHEVAEMMTNLIDATTTAWEDSAGQEIGDKCAWISLANRTFASGNTYAVQGLWSNASGSCVFTYGVAPTPTPVPTATPVGTPTPKPQPSPTTPPCTRQPCPQIRPGHHKP